VGLNKLTWDWADALTVLYSTTTDQEGHFAFDKVPAGEFVLSVESRAWQKLDQPTVRALQTPVTVSPGESQTVLLGTNGRSVLARLRADFSGAMPAWTNALAILSRDVAVRPEPARSDYLSNASHMAARFRYTHDPTVLAALREARSHVGEVNADGTAIFHDIPAGRYVLEVKLFNESSAVPQQSGFRENPVNSRLRATVSVPDGTDTADNAAPLSLGEFILEPL
jgi:hypothetical protein